MVSDPLPEVHTTAEQAQPDSVWTYRGYRLGPGEFNTAMVHLYRGEIARANIWRQRLDATTNWAVITTGATITFAFSQSLGHHSVIILNTLLVTLFLYIEARRYLYYELWSSRIRLMETDYFASMLVPPFAPADDWAESLAESLLQPHHSISMWEGFGRRFRRNYFWIYMILGLAWLARVTLLPAPIAALAEFNTRAAIGTAPGWMVLAAGLAFNGLLMLLGLVTVGLQQATGEILPRFHGSNGRPAARRANAVPGSGSRLEAWFRTGQRRQQFLAYIVTDQAERVGRCILSEMGRGLTSLEGTGMYTRQQHQVLMCALTVTEIPHLKKLISQADPRAFVIVSPAQEVLGEGFLPLESRP